MPVVFRNGENDIIRTFRREKTVFVGPKGYQNQGLTFMVLKRCGRKFSNQMELRKVREKEESQNFLLHKQQQNRA